MSEIKKRIVEFLEFKGKDKTNAAIEIGIARGSFSNNSEVGGSTIQKFYKNYPDVNLHWLLTGEGSLTIQNIELDQTQYIAECKKNIEVLHKAIEMLYAKYKDEK